MLANLAAQVEILTHEMAHQLNVANFQSDRNNDTAQKANQALVDAKCGFMVETLGSVSPYSLTFTSQTVCTSSTAQKVTLTNIFPKLKTLPTIQAITLDAPTIVGLNYADFSVQDTTCGSALAYGGQCTYSIVFKPTGMGSRTAFLFINDDTPHSPQLVTLTGTGN